MTSRIAMGIVAGLSLGLSGCQGLQQLNRDLASVNQVLSSGSRSGGPALGGGMAVLPEAGTSQQTQLIVPKDTRTAEAMDAALPTIKKVLSLHQCMKNYDSLRLLNSYAVPGADMAKMRMSMMYDYYPNSDAIMKYHDRNKCVSVRAIDQWAMPALNALQFRTVYFAEDSGETVNFTYLFKRESDGSWKIASFQKGS